MHPEIVRKWILPAHELLLRRGTLPYLRRLHRSQWWPAPRLREYQVCKLRRLLRHARTMCPFYRDRIASSGIDPDRATLDDLPRLPTLSKTDIRDHKDVMIDPSVPGGLFPYSTGGSTGDPLQFWIDRRRQAADQAGRARTRAWFGIELGERELYVWGSPVELNTQDRLKRIRDHLTNHRLLNAFDMTPKRMSCYLDEIERFDPVHLFGYPSSLARLVRHAHDAGRRIQCPSLKAVFTTGELFSPADRAIIEETVAVPVADGYGSREAGFIAHQCPRGSYHVSMESLIVELLDTSEARVNGDHPGEITVTHLDARGMPFIRYRTGDMARWSRSACPCGRGLESLEIVEGRKTDMLRTTDGGFAHALSVIYILREEPSIRHFKVEQQSDLNLDVRIVSDGSWDADRRRRISDRLRKRIGHSIDVRLHLVNEIEPDPSGKHRYVLSRAE